MKTLTLLRHAKSIQAQPELCDFDRPLNHRGKIDAPEMGRRLAALNLHPMRIISSPAVRARATAEAVADAIGIPKQAIIWEAALYEASPEDLLSVLRRQPDSSAHVILVGHNPALTQLANALTRDHLDNLPTAGAYTLSLPHALWGEIALGSGTRLAYDCPKFPFVSG